MKIMKFMKKSEGRAVAPPTAVANARELFPAGTDQFRPTHARAASYMLTVKT